MVSPNVKYSSNCNVDGVVVKYRRNFQLMKEQCQPRQYSELRTAYDKIVDFDKAQIVIKKCQ